MADLERQTTQVRTVTIVAQLKSLVAEVRSEACKLSRLKPADYTLPAEIQQDVENIYTLLDTRLKELESAVEHVVTANELLNLNSARNPGSTIDESEATHEVLNDSTQQASDQDQTTTSDNEEQPSTSQPDVTSEPHPNTATASATPPATPSTTQSEETSPEPRPKSYAKKITSNAAKAAVHKRRVNTRTSARLNKMAQPEPNLGRYEKYIDDRDDIPTLELQQLGENLAATIDALASDANQIQKAQVSGLAEAMKHRPTDTWNLEPSDGGDVNRNMITVDSDDIIRIGISNKEQFFHWPGFGGLNYRMTTREAGRKLACFVNDPDRSVSHYAGVVKSPLWDLCPLHAGRLAEIEELRRANEPYTHCGEQYSGTAMHQEDANFGSVNVGFAGTRAFLLVDTRDTKMFEDWVRDTIPDVPPKGKCCDQWVRHLGIFFRPEQLDGAGIRFTILLQRVGDLIFTKRNQYHQVINLQNSLSLSSNYISGSETPTFFDQANPLRCCQTKCSLAFLYFIAGFNVEIVNNKGKKRKALHDDDEDNSKSVKVIRSGDEPKNEPLSAGVIRDFLRTAAPDLNMPLTLDPSEVHLYRMIAWVLSDQAKQQIVSLMLGFRTAPTIISKKAELTDENHVNAYLRYFEQVEKQTILTEFQVEYARSCLAKRTLEILQEEGRDRVTSTNVDQVAQKLGMDTNTYLKMKDHYHTGRAWNKVCDEFDGLMPFIFTCARWPYKWGINWKSD
ncbi:transcription factor jumonji [Fusarium subglutinans]|uniref:Transcription factor jumonji n=1 Tax=Gibberella subglutinans TaxID=42677 RepID=A0A8H5Q2A8_GIBSU|nr:transcription factor jumonji [Fusarium subglutinans]KAF5606291.1 transcription factor jumonji [Fusarium subglutinans]